MRPRIAERERPHRIPAAISRATSVKAITIAVPRSGWVTDEQAGAAADEQRARLSAVAQARATRGAAGEHVAA